MLLEPHVDLQLPDPQFGGCWGAVGLLLTSHSVSLGILQDSVAPICSFLSSVLVGLYPLKGPFTVILVGFQEEREISENVQSAIFTQKSLTAR